jgi:hypothetical protein
MEKVLALIRQDVAEDKVRVDTPTQNLESYFLDVVQRARRASAETSGATSGAQVAAYLRAESEPRSGDRILERLSQATPVPAPTAPVPAAPAQVVKEEKLAALAQPAPAPSTPVEKPAVPKVDLNAANEKLSSLLNKPPGK